MMHCNRYIAVVVTLLFACGEKPDDHAHHAAQDTVNVLAHSPSEVIASSQRTIRPRTVSNEGSVSLNGYIAADERRNNNISVRVGGRIEKLHARFGYQYIKQGSPVMEIYSPELNTAAEEYLLLYKSNPGDPLVAIGRERLRLMGLSNAQITRMENSGKISRTFTVFSEYSGYLFTLSDGPKQGSSEGESDADMGGMESQGPSQESYAGSVIREGAYVNKGQTIFTVNDLREVWAMLMIDPGITVKKGDSVLLHIGKSVVNGVVGFTESYYSKEQKFDRVRVYLDNSDQQFRVNDLVTAELRRQGKANTLFVPSQSVLDLGLRKIVWVKTGAAGQNSLFEAREVTTGQILGGNIEILSGLKAREEIAETAGFMVDSESLIDK